MLKVISLKKIYQNGTDMLRVLYNVSFTVKDGEFVAIMGASGSGKTTLLNIIGGLENPTEGRVLVNEINLFDLTEEERTCFRRQHIGIIFQSFNLIPVLSVLDNIILPSRLMERAAEENLLSEIVKELDIEDILPKMPGVLSGGQQQRAAIARALYTKPTVMLADEPTGSLDSQNSRAVIGLMRQMSEKYRQTMIVVTHDERIAKLAGRIIRIEDGKVSGV